MPTRLRITEEVLGGCWDALQSRRADLAVGASGDAPVGGGFATQVLGRVDFVFAVAPHHPLAQVKEPLRSDDLAGYRVIALADTSRNLPSRSLGLQGRQEVLTVPSPHAKVAAQIAGIGIGYLPRKEAEPHLANGTLLEKSLDEPLPYCQLSLAWRSKERGKALNWFLERLANMRFSGVHSSS